MRRKGPPAAGAVLRETRNGKSLRRTWMVRRPGLAACSRNTTRAASEAVWTGICPFRPLPSHPWRISRYAMLIGIVLITIQPPFSTPGPPCQHFLRLSRALFGLLQAPAVTCARRADPGYNLWAACSRAALILPASDHRDQPRQLDQSEARSPTPTRACISQTRFA